MAKKKSSLKNPASKAAKKAAPQSVSKKAAPKKATVKKTAAKKPVAKKSTAKAKPAVASAVPNPVGWFEIYVQDMARAKAFYETVFNVKLSKLPAPLPGLEMLAFPMSETGPGASGAIVKMDQFSPSGNGTLVYFMSQDCTTEESRIVGAGGKIQQPKTSIGPYGFISMLIDTEGNTFGLHSRK